MIDLERLTDDGSLDLRTEDAPANARPATAALHRKRVHAAGAQAARPLPRLAVDLMGLSTSLPEHVLTQDDAIARAKRLFPAYADATSIFTNAGITARRSVMPADWHNSAHSWSDRAALFDSAGHDLAETTARKVLAASGLAPGDIDGVVTVCTTGISVPGLDVTLCNRLGLAPSVQRLPLFGLGCAGGVSGLARAAHLASADPGANILVVCVELCSINFRSDDKSKANFVSSALFADGAAGFVLRARPTGDDAATPASPTMGVQATVRFCGEHLWPKSEYAMGWAVEDDGLGVVISTDIPTLARRQLRPAVEAFLSRCSVSRDDLAGLIFHPGGARVLDAIADALECPADDLLHARTVLADYGNMSSPTALFVLERTLASRATGRHLLGAFGPGFTASFAILDVPGEPTHREANGATDGQDI